MNVESRLKKIEDEVCGQGKCRCRNKSWIYYTPPVFAWQNGEKPPDNCPECGGAVQSLEVIYVENWRGFRA